MFSLIAMTHHAGIGSPHNLDDGYQYSSFGTEAVDNSIALKGGIERLLLGCGGNKDWQHKKI